MKSNINKNLFYTTCIIAAIGLLAATNVIYTHINKSNYAIDYHNQPDKFDQANDILLNQRLAAAENQIEIITNENNKLRQEISSLKQELSTLNSEYLRLKQIDG